MGDLGTRTTRGPARGTDTLHDVTLTEVNGTTITVRSTYRDGRAIVAQRDRVRAYSTLRELPKAGVTRAVYTESEIAAIDALYTAQTCQGATTRRAADVEVGAVVGPLVKGPLTISDLVAYRAGVGAGPFGVEPLRLGYLNRRRRPGFYDRNASHAFDARERLHWDDAYAIAHGHPGAYDYSHTRLLWAMHLITDWMGDDAELREINFEQLANNYVGDTHWLSATITSVADEDVKLSYEGHNQRGVLTCRGTGTLRLAA